MNSPLVRDRHERFLELLRPIRPSLARFCRAMMRGDNESARDLAQDTIVIAYEYLDSIREPQRFRSYLFTTASRLAKRRKWRERNRVSYDPLLAEAIADNGTAPTDRGLEVEMLYQALDRLPEEMKEAVILFEITGFSLEEVAEMQSASLSAVKSRVSRGRQKLAEMLRVKETPPNIVIAPAASQNTSLTDRSEFSNLVYARKGIK